ncbi:H-type small acid-soluble spore protein [Paenibacillus sp. TRM 82003]|nr:H-type small acid-soluble spore protein [Paenibacillus sp. TRM 82003]
MDVNRAKEIIDSPKQYEVQLNGKGVWIDSVDATTKTATVHPQGGIDQPSMTVRVDELVEVGLSDVRL